MTDAAESQSGTSKAVSPRGGALDALRLLAAFFVLIFHYADEAPTPLSDLHAFMGRGYLATDFFLLLSGFVLVKAYGRSIVSGKVGYGEFMTKRLARVYPAHLITLFGLVLAVLLAGAIGHTLDHPEHFRWSDIPGNLLLLQSFGWGGDTWNIPSWTISGLMACYIFFPMLWRAVRRIESAAFALVLAVTVLLLANALSLLLLKEEQFNLPFNYGLGRTIPLFISGVVLARFVEIAKLGPAKGAIIGLAGCAAFGLIAWFNGPDMWSVLATMAVMVGCGSGTGQRKWIGAEWGAKISFTLFLIHTITGAIWFDAVRPLLNKLQPNVTWQWVIWFGAIAFAVTAAAVFHEMIDEPIQKRLNRWIKAKFAKKPTAVAAPAPVEAA
jgi:peptidoglycan/LPS O-acetylase OafA/YrhL